MPEISVIDLQAATAALQAATTQVRTDHKAMSEWATTQADFVTVKDESGLDVQVPSLDYLNRQFSILETDVRSLIGDLYARPIAEFYAERERNLALYRASGMVQMGKHFKAGTERYTSINQGMWTDTGLPSVLNVGYGNAVNAIGESATPYAKTVIAGIVTDLVHLGHTDTRMRIKFPEAPDGKTTYHRGTGEVVTHSSVDAAFDAAAINPDVEVVTQRVDVYGLEFWLEAITPENPWVYPYGLIQSQATTMDGVATGSSTRPDSYYAVYPGDTSSRGKPVNLFVASAADQAKLLANPKHGIYRLADGSLVQKHAAQRTFAGPGNGDWGAGTVGIDSTQARYLGFAGGVLVSAQGARATAHGGSLYESQVQGYEGFKGTFKAVTAGKPDSGAGVNGECYFLVLGTYQRLNQGVCHPLNELGAAKAEGTTTDAAAWHQSTAPSITSLRECFTKVSVATSTGLPNTGFIGSVSGRADGRYYDAVYSGGFGGVTDLRLEARKQTQADHARVDALVKAGSYRGLETVKRTRVHPGSVGGSGDSWGVYYNDALPGAGEFRVKVADAATLSGLKVGDTLHVVDSQGRLISGEVSNVNDPAYPSCRRTSPDEPAIRKYHANTTEGWHLVVEVSTDLSVSGAYTHQTVAGNPADLAACPDTKDGWLGDWCPDFASDNPMLPQVALGNVIGNRLTSDDRGGVWNAVSGVTITKPANTVFTGIGANPGRIVIVNYHAWAAMTEPCANAKVRDAYAGLSDVWAGAAYKPSRGALLSASLIGKVITSSGNNFPSRKHYALTEYYINDADDALHAHPSYAPVHRSVALGAPDNNSPAVKALRYNHVADGQAVNCYAFTELGYDGDWGDSGIMPIVSNDGTWVDDNGHTRKAGTHKLALPFGWV